MRTDALPDEAPPRWRVLAGIAFHTVLLLFMPFVVGGVTGLFVDVAQVADTFAALVRGASALLLPVLVVQAVCVVIKVRRERAAARADEALTLDRTLRAVHRHVRVLTDKGVGLFLACLVTVSLALVFRVADLGLLAVFGLVLLYLLVAAGVIVSTLVVTRFEQRLATRRGTIGRTFTPVLAEAGEAVEEAFHFERVPVPAGFNLRVHQELPARLATETRHVVGSAVSMQRISLTRALQRTPRGEYRLDPAEIAYTDLLGLVRVSVAQAAGARLTVLPRMAPVGMGTSPRSRAPDEGVLSVLRRMPTDDWFRVRDYAPGDDARRMHWKLSLKVGRLQVRLPETVPVTPRRVRLALDTWLPADLAREGACELVLGDALDHLVELWLSLARALTERGEVVTLALASGSDAQPVTLVPCRRGTQPVWRAHGAAARWQSKVDVDALTEGITRDESLVVVGARFVEAPAMPTGSRVAWVTLPLVDEVPGEVPGVASSARGIERFVTLAFPPGAEENGWRVARQRAKARRAVEALRRDVLARITQGQPAVEASLRARGEAVYTARRSGPAYVLDAMEAP